MKYIMILWVLLTFLGCEEPSTTVNGYEIQDNMACKPNISDDIDYFGAYIFHEVEAPEGEGYHLDTITWTTCGRVTEISYMTVKDSAYCEIVETTSYYECFDI